MTAKEVDIPGIEVVSRVTTDAMPKAMLQILKEFLQQEAEGGGNYGNPLMGLRLTIESVSFREGESTEVAIHTAVHVAFGKVLTEGNLAVLEPVMSLEVVTPEDFIGNIQSDLNSRRAIIVNSDRRGDLCVLSCEVPLVEMFGYSNQVRSLSQGRASYSMQPCRYAVAPANVMESMS